ncbi:MAG TPA: MFS transporter, partial [Candidatus Eisenbacteria bacterium]|nr:MFS transporter [Candidatus Eisenbacteria bacterium]
VWTGYLLGAFSRVGYAFTTAWPLVIPFRILDRSGKIRSAPRDALIADVSTGLTRGKNFGLVRAMDHLGAVCGVVLCILLFKHLGYRRLLLLAAAPSLIAAVLVLSMIKEQRAPESKVFKGLGLRHLDRNFRLFLVLSALFALGSFSYSFLLVFAREFGFAEAFVPVLYLLFVASASLFSIPFGRLADRIGRKAVLLLSFVLWGLVCASFLFVRARSGVAFAFVLYGMHKGALEPVQKAFVSELAPKKYRASALGGFQMVVGLSALPASVVAGLLWDRVGMLVPFYLSLGLTAAAAAMLVLVREPAGETRRAGG